MAHDHANGADPCRRAFGSSVSARGKTCYQGHRFRAFTAAQACFADRWSFKREGHRQGRAGTHPDTGGAPRGLLSMPGEEGKKEEKTLIKVRSVTRALAQRPSESAPW
jgi:hypothetical protein